MVDEDTTWMSVGESSLVKSWDDVEKLYHHALYNELRVAPEERPVIVSEPPLSSRADREKLTQMMFETYDVPGLYVASSAVLSLYASGRTSGLVLESGERFTHSVPVYEGHSLPYATIRLELGGRLLTDFMGDLLSDRGYSLTTSAEREVVRDIKEKLGFVCLDFEKERKKGDISKPYELPDGQVISVGEECFICPEALFQPKLIGVERPGIQQAVWDSISRADSSLNDTLSENIILSGGNTLFPGIVERLQKEADDCASGKLKRVHVYAPPERRFSVWIGGSILSSLSTFRNIAITKEEYDEVGPWVVHRKCF